jgi:hypothetical protein
MQTDGERGQRDGDDAEHIAVAERAAAAVREQSGMKGAIPRIVDRGR